MILLLAVLFASSPMTEGVAPDVVTLPLTDIETIDRYADPDGFYIFLPAQRNEPLNIVVFVHGFGALNPVVYGGWIEHLTRNGNAVVFARYQEGIFSTPTTDFVPNTISAILNARSALGDENISFDGGHIDLIGHSYGGVIIGNIAANHEEYGLPRPRIVLLCEPGSGPLTGGVLESYDQIPADVSLAIVVGDEDRTVGQSLGLKVFETATNTPRRVLFWQYADENGEESVGATHYEPYSYNHKFDNSIDNFTVKRAENVSSLDAVDHNGYWQIFDTLRECEAQGKETLDETTLHLLADLGTWSDGTPIKPMEVYTANSEVVGK